MTSERVAKQPVHVPDGVGKGWGGAFGAGGGALYELIRAQNHVDKRRRGQWDDSHVFGEYRERVSAVQVNMTIKKKKQPNLCYIIHLSRAPPLSLCTHLAAHPPSNLLCMPPCFNLFDINYHIFHAPMSVSQVHVVEKREFIFQ